MAKTSKTRNGLIEKQVRSGLSLQEIANHHGLSKGRVSQILKENNVKVQGALVRDNKIGREIIQNNIDLQQTMVRAHGRIERLCDMIEDAVFENDEDVLKRLKDFGMMNLGQELRAANKEVREGVKDILSITSSVQEMKDAAEFKDRIIEAIKMYADKDTTRKIVGHLREGKALETVIKG